MTSLGSAVALATLAGIGADEYDWLTQALTINASKTAMRFFIVAPQSR